MHLTAKTLIYDNGARNQITTAARILQITSDQMCFI